MDLYDLHNIKIGKPNAMLKIIRPRIVTSLFRLLEVCVCLIVISKLTTELPSAMKISGAYFKDLTVFLASQRFVFIIGNVIVITLFAKSGQFSGQVSVKTDIYKEFVENTEKKQTKVQVSEFENRVKESHDLVNGGRQRVLTEKRGKQSSEVENRVKQSINEKSLVTTTDTCEERKIYQRTQSEIVHRVNSTNLKVVKSETEKCMKRAEVVKSETEKCMKRADSIGAIVKKPCPEDAMTNEEFRDKVDAFIARQKKFMNNSI